MIWTFYFVLHSFTHSLSISFTRVFTRSFTYSLIQTFTHSLDQSLTTSLTHPVNYSLFHLPGQLIINLLSHSLTHLLTYSLSLSLAKSQSQTFLRLSPYYSTDMLILWLENIWCYSSLLQCNNVNKIIIQKKFVNLFVFLLYMHWKNCITCFYFIHFVIIKLPDVRIMSILLFHMLKFKYLCMKSDHILFHFNGNFKLNGLYISNCLLFSQYICCKYTKIK